MAHTHINLDDDALARARERLGTRTKVETVNTALCLAAETGPRPRRRYVPAAELRAALAGLHTGAAQRRTARRAHFRATSPRPSGSSRW